MKPPTNEQIKEWATSHLCNVHGLDPDSPVLEEGFLLSRAHFVTGVLRTIEYFQKQSNDELVFYKQLQEIAENYDKDGRKAGLSFLEFFASKFKK